MPDYRLAVAPMMDWTDRHCRYFHRLLSPSALLYTEMVTTGAILYGDKPRHLDFSEQEHPLALQLGGSDPGDLSRCAKIVQDWGYDEVNLNVGCPSDRVQKGRFGACLMKEPALVRDCVAAMMDAVSIPVTVKTRLGVDDLDSYAYFRDFIGRVGESGCGRFIVHARKAWLRGLSPKQNRDIPELNYARVYRLKQEMPNLHITLNGGVTDPAQVQTHLEHVDGVMLGRAAYQNPLILNQCQAALYGDEIIPMDQLIDQLVAYARALLENEMPLKRITRHLLGLFQGVPGAKQWRRLLSEKAHLPNADERLILQAYEPLRSIYQAA